MRIVALSDTHGKHQKVDVPEGDVLIHCGDFSHNDMKSTFLFLNWFQHQPHKHKIMIAGNHDGHIELLSKTLNGTHYLHNSQVTIEGIKFWGSPYTPIFGRWHYMLDYADLARNWGLIPDDTDILITHGPPRGILDWVKGDAVNAGCEQLWKAVADHEKIKHHFFGHIHENYGTAQYRGKSFHNVAVVNDRHELYYVPRVIDL